jgi:hypothetical protein
VPSDPSWLLSAIAEASATLVAIVGGLLVSRIVGLAAEKEGLLRRRRELTIRLALAQDEYQPVHDERVVVSREWFLEHHLDDFVQARGQVDLDLAIKDFTPLGSSRDEMLPFAKLIATAIGNAFNEVNARFTDGEYPLDLEELVSDGFEIPDGETAIYKAVLEQLDRERPPPTVLASAIH